MPAYAIVTEKLLLSVAAVVLAACSGVAQADTKSFPGFAHGSHTVRDLYQT